MAAALGNGILVPATRPTNVNVERNFIVEQAKKGESQERMSTPLLTTRVLISASLYMLIEDPRMMLRWSVTQHVSGSSGRSKAPTSSLSDGIFNGSHDITQIIVSSRTVHLEAPVGTATYNVLIPASCNIPRAEVTASRYLA